MIHGLCGGGKKRRRLRERKKRKRVQTFPGEKTDACPTNAGKSSAQELGKGEVISGIQKKEKNG